MNAFFDRQRAALRDAAAHLLASPLSTTLSLLVIGLALALPAAGHIVLENLRNLAGPATGSQEISLFMNQDTGKKESAEIESRLRELRPGKWRFVSRDEALKRLKSSEGMADIIASLPRNPLPDAFVIDPEDLRPESLEKLASVLSSWPGVAHVQLDSAWVRRFDALLRIGKLSVLLLAGLFSAALVAVSFHTIRLQILARAAEIEVARLIGATDAFIRRPFQYFGALQGGLGGLLAALLVYGGGSVLSGPVSELITLYGSSHVLLGLEVRSIAVLSATGAMLGWIGARFSVAIHLHRLG